MTPREAAAAAAGVRRGRPRALRPAADRAWRARGGGSRAAGCGGRSPARSPVFHIVCSTRPATTSVPKPTERAAQRYDGIGRQVAEGEVMLGRRQNHPARLSGTAARSRSALTESRERLLACPSRHARCTRLLLVRVLPCVRSRMAPAGKCRGGGVGLRRRGATVPGLWRKKRHPSLCEQPCCESVSAGDIESHFGCWVLKPSGAPHERQSSSRLLWQYDPAGAGGRGRTGRTACAPATGCQQGTSVCSCTRTAAVVVRRCCCGTASALVQSLHAGEVASGPGARVQCAVRGCRLREEPAARDGS